MKYLFNFFVIVVLLTGCKTGSKKPAKIDTEFEAGLEIAIFAGGCFWCMETPFEKLAGVKSALSGYTGGNKANPTYEQVSAGGTGHVEAVRVAFDPKVISYKDLLQVFWRQVNPTDSGGQFVDRGDSYVTGIYYTSKRQKALAEASKVALQKSGRFKKPVVTPIIEAGLFYPAEEYHQDYYKKNPVRYKYYRNNSGRDQYLDKTWGKDRHYTLKKKTKGAYVIPSKEELKKKLTKIQYKVTQKEGTEPPYKNEYWDNKEAGIYVDVVSGEPLFSSLDKYDSGTGWPSFFKPLVEENVTQHKDRKLFVVRTEVRSKHANSHLGHVFEDGPKPTGLRFCINSASLRFVPVAKLKEEGYDQFLALFK